MLRSFWSLMLLAKSLLCRKDGTILPTNSKVKLMSLILSKGMRVITLQLHWELLVTKGQNGRKVARMTPATTVVSWVTMQETVSWKRDFHHPEEQEVDHQEAEPLHLEKEKEGVGVVPKAKAKAIPGTIPIHRDPDLLTPKDLQKGAGFQAPRGTDTIR